MGEKPSVAPNAEHTLERYGCTGTFPSLGLWMHPHMSIHLQPGSVWDLGVLLHGNEPAEAAGFGWQRCQGLQRDEQPSDFSCLQHHGHCELWWCWEGRALRLDTLWRGLDWGNPRQLEPGLGFHEERTQWTQYCRGYCHLFFMFVLFSVSSCYYIIKYIFHVKWFYRRAKSHFSGKWRNILPALSARQRLLSHKLPLKGLDITGWSSSAFPVPCSPSYKTCYGPSARADGENTVPCYFLFLQRSGHCSGFEGSMRGHPGYVLSHRCPSWLKNSCWQRCRISQAICSPAKLSRLVERFP